jgi:nucleoside-diphosphate-sugar epimerase
LKRLIILGSSGFVGKSLNDYLKKKKTFKIINFSRSVKKDILLIKKLPKSDFIIYCINNKNIKISLKYFFHFRELLKDISKNTKILFFSSGAVYGPRSIKKNFNEKENINPKKYNKFTGYKKKYAKEKFLLETEFKKISKNGYKVSIIRGFTFYGKYILKYDYLISKILKAVKKKSKLIIKNKNTFRTFMHSDDMCMFLIKVLEKSSFKCCIYNLGSSEVIDLEKFVNFLNKKYNSNIIFDNSNTLIDYYVPSTLKIFRDFNFKKLTSFNKGIKLLLS